MPFTGSLLFAAALVVGFLTSWILLPPPNRPLLALAVGAPELCAWLILASLVIAVMSRARRARTRLADATLAIAVVAGMVASVPLLRVPSAAHRFDQTMRSALGDEFLRDVPADRQARMRPMPVVLFDLFRGLDTGNAQVRRGILFAAPEGVSLTVDIYGPTAPGSYPSIVQIYGGAWQRGEPADDAGFATYLASRGFVVFAIDYRHAPRWQWPAPFEDVRAALRWILTHGRKYDADTSRLALLGRSAGAQLAMVAAYEPGAIPVDAVVSYYGPTDLNDGYRNPPSPDPLDVRSIDEAYLGGTPDSAPTRYREASPVTYAARGAPPSLLIHGSRDHVVSPRVVARLDHRLRAAGATSVLLEIPWAEHAFDAIPNGPSGQLALYYTERFLAWALTRPSPDGQE